MYPISSEHTYENDMVVFDEGSDEEKVYVVLSGAIKIIKDVRGEDIVVEVMRQGEIFGEMAFVTGMPRSATARAMGTATVGVISPEALDNEFENLSPIMKKIMQSLVDRLKKATDNSLGVSFIRKAPRYLKTLPVRFENGHTFLETLTRDASCGGMFISTDMPLGYGETFQLSLTLPDGEKPLKIPCKVAWVRTQTDDPENFPLGMGVKFLRLDKVGHNRLKRILQQV
jgi:uncharacterized protein (TIGR02266 family)